MLLVPLCPLVFVENGERPQGRNSLEHLWETCPRYSHNRGGESPPVSAEGRAGALSEEDNRWPPWVRTDPAFCPHLQPEGFQMVQIFFLMKPKNK